MKKISKRGKQEYQMALKSGDQIGEKYILGDKVGEDDFGTWYVGENTKINQKVMIKILAPQMHTSAEASQRFVREISLLSNLHHRGIVKVHEAGEENGTYFMISEFQEGLNLEQYLENQGVIPEKDAVSLLQNIVEALQYAWETNKLVHRDIKPTKIFITDDNQVRICDLGLAKSTSDDTMNLTGAGFTVGTPDYMSPEQASGDDLDFRSDMYSHGLVLYKMVTGKKAFEGPVMEILQKQLSQMPTPASQVNPMVTNRCETLIERMIQKNKKDRFQSWNEVLDAMQTLLDTTILETDLQIFNVNDLNSDDEPSFESLTTEDDGVFGGPKINSSGIIIEEEVADNSLAVDDHVAKPAVDAIEAGAIIGNGYEIDRKIGDGSMGEIYLAFSEENDKLVQIKILPAHMTDDHEKVERFLQEIKISSTLHHPNLLSVIEAGEDGGRYYLVTEYEEGISYHDFIGRYGPLHEKDALHFLCQIAEVLNYAWKEKKLLHREVKPENILIKEESKEAKLTDFGVAKQMSDEALNLTGMGFTIGTPDYMSPEQVQGDENLDCRSDMYALGLVLYESLTKKKPFQADNVMALMNKQMTEKHKPVTTLNPKVSANCSNLIDRLLSKQKEGRFASWDELIKVMRRVADGGTVPPIEPKSTTPSAGNNSTMPKSEKTVTNLPPSAPAASKSTKGNGLLIVGAIVVIAVIAVLVYIFK